MCNLGSVIRDEVETKSCGMRLTPAIMIYRRK